MGTPNQNHKGKGKHREFIFGSNSAPPNKFMSNYIKTTKYSNFFTFLILCPIYQLIQVANLYFLFVAVIQSIPSISVLDPTSAILPLVFVILLSMTREGIEDLTRYKSDKEVNSMKSLYYSKGKWENITWSNIRVGHIVKVLSDEFVPADLVLCGSSTSTGLCFIETSSLDGEKNLKPKLALKDTMESIGDCRPMRLAGKIVAGDPTSDLGAFDGLINVGTKNLGLGVKQLIYRGCVLRNTEWIVGVVVYTGYDTKLMKNSEEGRFKMSQNQKKLGKLLIFIFILNLSFCTASAVLAYFWGASHNVLLAWLIGNVNEGFTEFIVNFLRTFILMNTMIPISLIVSLEIVKLAQAYFIDKDEEMYCSVKQREPKVFTSAINEDLGLVDYVFTDKTGTLTVNQMDFKYCVIGNSRFGDSSAKENKFYDAELLKLVSGEKSTVSTNLKILSKTNPRVESYKIMTQNDLVREFLLVLCVCHDCVVEKDKTTGNIKYQGQSPDEIALVDTARQLSFVYKGSSSTTVMLEINNSPEEVEWLASFEFTSDRKRMSTIIKQDGIIKLYVKGADKMILERLSKKTNSQPFLDTVQKNLTQFSKEGFRTLCMAMKTLDQDEWAHISKIIELSAAASDKEEKLKMLAEEIETDLYLLGCTAVEDRLQDQVPEVIRDLLLSDIKVWMLTGDKLETAENIGYSCKLIQSDFTKLYCAESEDPSQKIPLLLKNATELSKTKQKKCALIEGTPLGKALNDIRLTKELIGLLKQCESVICCRVTPKQKADVVRLIKNSSDSVTLSIGDGANDVNMIQEAHIGVGIYGNEGMRAVQASDYALPEFKGLWRLLLVHGRWSYIRTSDMVLYFFYKNMIITFPQFLFLFYSGYSIQTIFDDWYITFYNLLFTSLPLVVRAVFDQDINYKKWSSADSGEKELKERENLKRNYPTIYRMNKKNPYFTATNFLLWLFQGLVHAVLIYFVCMYGLKNSILSMNGKIFDLWVFSITIYTACILIVNIKLAIFTKYWTVLNWISLILFSFGLFFGYVLLADNFWFFNVYKTSFKIFTTFHYYLLIVLLTVIVFAFDIMVLIFTKDCFPSLEYMYQRIVKTKREVNSETFDLVNKHYKAPVVPVEIELS